jgi:hypothetical protein
MFTKNILLGLLSFAMASGLWNVSGAIAQSVYKSDRYLSDQEIQALEANLQISNGEAFSRINVDPRKSFEINQINQFVNVWQKADPSIAPFLGNWSGYEESLMFYPSKHKGQICVVMQYFEGRQGVQRLLNVGKVSGNKLITDGQLGKIVFVRRKGKLQKQSTSATPIREVDFIGMFGNFFGKKSFTAYIFPRRLPEIDDNRLSKFRCTTGFPSTQ